MKKLLCILLTAILCLSVVSCTDTPETTPNEIEPPEIVTPNEMTEPDTPEIVTPSESEPDEPEETVIILPEADANTKYITIDFPENFPKKFPEKPYVEPVLVSPKEFEWGEYLPVITYGTNTVAHDEWVLESAILSSESDNLTAAHDIYTNEYEHLSEYLYDQNYKAACLRRENQEVVDKVGLFFPVVNGHRVIYINGIKHNIIINEGILEEVQITPADSCNDKLWLIEVFYQYKFAIYLYNAETDQSVFWGNHFFNASLSPDGKYLAYTSPVGQLCDMQSASDYSAEKQGFYVENLENGKTVFYPCANECNPYHGYHSIRAWAKK